MGICTNAVSIMLDIFTLCVYWPLEAPITIVRFGNFAAVSNIVLRIFSSLIFYRILKERAATYGNYSLPSSLDNILPSSSRRPYEDLDQPVPTQSLGPQATDSPTQSPS